MPSVTIRVEFDMRVPIIYNDRTTSQYYVMISDYDAMLFIISTIVKRNSTQCFECTREPVIRDCLGNAIQYVYRFRRGVLSVQRYERVIKSFDTIYSN